MKTVTYVKSMEGRPLMPCEPAVARLLLKQGKAKVLRRRPFVIKLMYQTDTEHVQYCTKAEDTGSGTLGSAAVTDDGKVLYMSETEVRNDTRPKMDNRRKMRRDRRNRKTRYRKARFLNRHNSAKNDRFSPTMRSKLHSHEKELEFMAWLLPCRKEITILETGTFDPAAMKNPSLRSEKVIHWGYQKGPNYGFANTKAMVLNRDGYRCRHCGKKEGTLEVHHIIFRSNGGSDDAENLITLCESCHSAVHKGEFTIRGGRKKGNLSYATQMNSIRKQLLKSHPEAIETFGYVTKENRQMLKLSKRHCVDAAVAASGGKPLTFRTETCYTKRAFSDGDFAQTQGDHRQQKLNTGKVSGFRKFDKVRYLGKEYFIKGKMSTGYAILMDIHGNKADFSSEPKGWKTPKFVNMKRISARKTCMLTTEAVTLNSAMKPASEATIQAYIASHK